MMRIRDAKKKHEKYLLSLPNVVSVGIGKKRTGGTITDEIAIIVGVRRKLPPYLLNKEDIIPPKFEDEKGIFEHLTDVVEVKDIFLLPPLQADNPRTQRIRPVKGGYSIGNVAITAGTLGCMVHRGNEAFFLSNAHVFTPDPTAKVAVQTQIVQPGPYDGGKSPDDLVGFLEDYIPISPLLEITECPVSFNIGRALTKTAKVFRRKSRFMALAETNIVNLVDAAIARPMVPAVSEVEGIGVPTDIAEPALGATVRKSGRTTQDTVGVVDQIDVTISVNYGWNGYIPKMALFTDQILIGSAGQFSQGGDSGSAIFDATNPLLCGLLFAGNDDGSVTIANKISNVFNLLNLNL